MERSIDTYERCRVTIATLDAERGWSLGAEQQVYVTTIAPFVPEACSDMALRAIVQNYHADHDLVRSLLDQDHPDHTTAWQSWLLQSTKIIQHRKRIREHVLISIDDLTQHTLEELISALPSYGYRSRFSTWAYSIIIRSTQRYLEKQQAAKRGGRVQDIGEEDLATLQVAMGAQDVELRANDRALVELIESILTSQGNRRLAIIFRLWAIDDMRLVDIGKCVDLDASRISVLLKQARELLSQHPEIRAWFGLDMTDSAE